MTSHYNNDGDGETLKCCGSDGCFTSFFSAARQQLTVRLCLSAFFKLADRFCFFWKELFFAFKCVWDIDYDDGDDKRALPSSNPWNLFSAGSVGVWEQQNFSF